MIAITMQRLHAVGVAFLLLAASSGCSRDSEGHQDTRGAAATTTSTSSSMRPSITQAGEPVQGIPPELDRTSEAMLSDALSSATRSVLDRAPTAAERRQFVDAFWQAELTWTLAQEQGISSPRPDVQLQALRYAERLSAEAG